MQCSKVDHQKRFIFIIKKKTEDKEGFRIIFRKPNFGFQSLSLEAMSWDYNSESSSMSSNLNYQIIRLQLNDFLKIYLWRPKLVRLTRWITNSRSSFYSLSSSLKL